MAKRRAADMKKAKESRQKKIAIVGGVVFLALMAFQVPRTLKMLNPPDPDAAAAVVAPTPTTAGPVTLEPPTLGGGAGGTATPAPSTPATAADGDLADSDPSPEAGAGQLISFGLFASKDPFAVQVRADGAGPGAAPGDAPATAGDAPATAGDDTAKPTGAGSGEAGGTPPTAAPTSAVIALDGERLTIALAASFPEAEPVFRLAGLTRTSARIEIAGGAYADGQATVPLALGKTLTLMNTANGRRYELRLVSVG